MGAWIPRWLAASYESLLERFEGSSFTSEEAARAGVAKPQVVLPRLEKAGWLHRHGRGVYSTADPRVAIRSCFGDDWRSKVPQKQFVALIESALGSMLSGYQRRLEGAVLYGSVARGTAKETSDIDIIALVEGLPESYGERVREAAQMVRGVPVRAEGEPPGAFHDLGFVLLRPSELEEPYPFLLDVVNDGVILYDRDGSTAEKLLKIKREFEKMGAVRTQLADGSWYWALEVPRLRTG